MESWKRIRAAAAVVSLCLLAVLLAVPMGAMGRGMVILLTVLGIVAMIASERRIAKLQADSHIIRLINHHRHDWMNELQVMLGLLRLNKIDKLQDYMDNIKARAMHESNMSRLGNPALIAYLLNLRADQRTYSLEVEIDEEIHLGELKMGAERVYGLIRSITESFAACAVASQGEPNVLNVSFEREDDRLMLDFVYTGQINGELESRLGECLARYAGQLELEEEHFTEEKAVLTLLLPFRT